MVTQLTPFGARVRLYEGEPPVPYEILAPVRLRVGPGFREGRASRQEAERRLREMTADVGGNAVVRLRWRSGWRVNPLASILWFLAAPLRLFLRDGAHELEAHEVEGVAVRLLPVRLRAPRPTVAGRAAPARARPERELFGDGGRVDLFRGEPPHPYRILGPVEARAGPSMTAHEPSLVEAERRLREKAAALGATAVIHVEARFGFRARPWATVRYGLAQWIQYLGGRPSPPDFAVRLQGVAVELYPLVTRPRPPTSSSARSNR